jgi:acetyl esterase/lipase
MKKIVSILLALVVPFCFAAGQVRYLDEIFSNVSMREGVQYGSNIGNTGQVVTLLMDHFQPVGDSASRRPVIIFIHGGAYISGSRTESKVREFCTRFSRRGYITSSIDYRLGVANPFSRSDFIQAAYRGMQDARAAVRYFRRREIADSLHVDTTKIFIGGFSAGAFSSLNVACLDANELTPEIDSTLLGNIEGNSGNPGHSSKVLALMNCWGGVLDTTIIDPGDVSMISVHGTADPVVPYSSGVSIFAGIYLYGSATITARLQSLGIRSFFIPMPGVGHGFPSDSAQNAVWTETTIVSTAAFFHPLVRSTSVAPIANNLPDKILLEQNFPNPFNPSTTIKFSVPSGRDPVRFTDGQFTIVNGQLTILKVYDVLGREAATLVNERMDAGEYLVKWDASGVSSGVYFYRLTAASFVKTRKMILTK